MPGLYADENFPLPVVEELRRLGFDVLTMYEDGKANQSLSDEEVLAIATAQQRALSQQTADISSSSIGNNLITVESLSARLIRILPGRHDASRML